MEKIYLKKAHSSADLSKEEERGCYCREGKEPKKALVSDIPGLAPLRLSSSLSPDHQDIHLIFQARSPSLC